MNETGTMLEHQYEDTDVYEKAMNRVVNIEFNFQSEYGLSSLNQQRITVESPMLKKK